MIYQPLPTTLRSLYQSTAKAIVGLTLIQSIAFAGNIPQANRVEVADYWNSNKVQQILIDTYKKKNPKNYTSIVESINNAANSLRVKIRTTNGKTVEFKLPNENTYRPILTDQEVVGGIDNIVQESDFEEKNLLAIPTPEPSPTKPSLEEPRPEQTNATYPQITPEQFTSRLEEISKELINSQRHKANARPYQVILTDAKTLWYSFLRTAYPYVAEQDIPLFYQYIIKSPYFVNREEKLLPTYNKVVVSELAKLLNHTQVIQQYAPKFSEKIREQLTLEIKILEEHKKRIIQKGNWAENVTDKFIFTEEIRDSHVENIKKVVIRAESYLPRDSDGNIIQKDKLDRNGWVYYHANSAIRTNNPFENDFTHAEFGTTMIMHAFQYRNEFSMDAWINPDTFAWYMDMHQRIGHVLDDMFDHVQKHTDLREYLQTCLQPEHLTINTDYDGKPHYKFGFTTTKEYVDGFAAARKHMDDIYQQNTSLAGFLERSFLKLPIHVLDRSFINLGKIGEDIGEGKIARLASTDVWRLLSNYFFFKNYEAMLHGNTDALASHILFGAGETSPRDAAEGLYNNLTSFARDSVDMKGRLAAGLSTYFNTDYLINGVPASYRFLHDSIR